VPNLSKEEKIEQLEAELLVATTQIAERAKRTDEDERRARDRAEIDQKLLQAVAALGERLTEVERRPTPLPPAAAPQSFDAIFGAVATMMSKQQESSVEMLRVTLENQRRVDEIAIGLAENMTPDTQLSDCLAALVPLMMGGKNSSEESEATT